MADAKAKASDWSGCLLATYFGVPWIVAACVLCFRAYSWARYGVAATSIVSEYATQPATRWVGIGRVLAWLYARDIVLALIFYPVAAFVIGYALIRFVVTAEK